MTDSEVLPYESIPNMPVTSIAHHAGKIVLGNLSGVSVLCMQGRIHFYEGYSMKKVSVSIDFSIDLYIKSLFQCSLSIRIMQLMGIKNIIITNAAGGINKKFKVGDIMIIKDHFNAQVCLNIILEL